MYTSILLCKFELKVCNYASVQINRYAYIKLYIFATMPVKEYLRDAFKLKKLRDVLQEREGTSLNYKLYQTIFSVYLGLIRSILDYLGLSRCITVYLGLSRSILVYISLSWSILDYLGILSWTISDYL